ncbi:hypothetical protein B5X24_HaOG205361 [Helicoverpa armigera]|uniref:Uncharacterized protein n=1 Tax=Helicoverpa armigera TaxID=29058 RepID=A0A2W1BLI4_HELAM|nr:hypothetical protein B5X24_HaOG205361 [Helicoverpa armigera]
MWLPCIKEGMWAKPGPVFARDRKNRIFQITPTGKCCENQCMQRKWATDTTRSRHRITVIIDGIGSEGYTKSAIRYDGYRPVLRPRESRSFLLRHQILAEGSCGAGEGGLRHHVLIKGHDHY